MSANATASSSTKKSGTRQSHAATFSKVLDGRKQPIRGLWERNGRFYAQLTVENAISDEKKVRRVPLKDKDAKPVETAAQALSEMKRLVLERAELPTFGFHDCRHYFISMCVMSGIDFMTIAAWVGHKDGGVLIGKVYGHLGNGRACKF
jgi:integrase